MRGPRFIGLGGDPTFGDGGFVAAGGFSRLGLDAEFAKLCLELAGGEAVSTVEDGVGDCCADVAGRWLVARTMTLARRESILPTSSATHTLGRRRRRSMANPISLSAVRRVHLSAAATSAAAASSTYPPTISSESTASIAAVMAWQSCAE